MNQPIRLDWGWVDEGFAPQQIPELLGHALIAHGYGLLQYGDPRGLLALRRELVERLKLELDLEVSLDAVTVTNGATGALDLVARSVLQRTHDSVVVAPVFDTAIEILKRNSRSIVQVLAEPFTDNNFTEGTWAALEVALRRPRSRLLYVIPTSCNPTGRTLSMDQRQRLGSLCENNGVVLVEDDPYRLYAPPQERFRPMYSPTSHRSVFIGSFSKRLYPGLRVGYLLAPPDLTHEIVELQRYTTSSANLLAQGVCLEALTSGLVDEATSYYYHALERKRAVFERAWEKYDCATVFTRSRNGSGPYVWLSAVGTDMQPSVYCSLLRAAGVLSVPGHIYYLDYPWRAAELRLSLLRVGEDDIDVALRILAETAYDAGSRGARSECSASE
jgi:DNA-binding transcriptional MocR family regulator